MAFTLYGPESLPLRRLFEHIGEAVGRPIRIETVTPDQARSELAATLPPFLADSMVRMWAANDGVPAPVSTIVPKITGRPAHTFAQWAVDHADDFR